MVSKFLVAMALAGAASAVDVGKFNGYWGQNGPPDERLRARCDEGPDYITLAFVNSAPYRYDGSGYAGINFASHCGAGAYTAPNGEQSRLLDSCTTIREDLEYCRSQGVRVLLSIGGEWSDPQNNYSLFGDDEGVAFAEFLYNAFGPYNATWGGPRPFDMNATSHTQVDGFDFDLEFTNGDSMQPWIAMANRFRELDNNLFLTAAPQCPTDAQFNIMGDFIEAAQLDALFIQFYNNQDCQLNSPGFNYDEWQGVLARSRRSQGAKLFVGLPANDTIPGYLEPAVLENIVCPIADRPTFGGISLWDMSLGNENVVQGTTYNEHVRQILARCAAMYPNPSSTTSTTTATTATSTTTSSSSTSSATTTTTTSSSSSVISSSSTTSSQTSTSSTSTVTSSSTSSSATSSQTSSQSSSSSVAPTSASTSSTSTVTSSSTSSSTTSSQTSSQSSSSSVAPTSASTSSVSTSTGTGSSTGSSTSTGTGSSTSSGAAGPTSPGTSSTGTTSSGTSSAASTSSVTSSGTSSAAPTSSVTSSATGSAASTSSVTSSMTSSGTGSAASTSSVTSSMTSSPATSTDVVTSTVWNNTTITSRQMTTSTVFKTTVYTISQCAPTVTDCTSGKVTTETISHYTTVCPVTETKQPVKPTQLPCTEPSCETETIHRTATVTSTLSVTSPSKVWTSVQPTSWKPAGNQCPGGPNCPAVVHPSKEVCPGGPNCVKPSKEVCPGGVNCTTVLPTETCTGANCPNRTTLPTKTGVKPTILPTAGAASMAASLVALIAVQIFLL